MATPKQQTVGDFAVSVTHQDAERKKLLTVDGVRDKLAALEAEDKQLQVEIDNAVICETPVAKFRTRRAEIRIEQEELQSAKAELLRREVKAKEEAEARRIAAARAQFVEYENEIENALDDAQTHAEAAFDRLVEVQRAAAKFFTAANRFRPGSAPLILYPSDLEGHISAFLGAALRKAIAKHSPKNSILAQEAFGVDTRRSLNDVGDGSWRQFFQRLMAGDMATLSTVEPRSIFTQQPKPVAPPRPADPSEMPFAGWPAAAIPTPRTNVAS